MTKLVIHLRPADGDAEKFSEAGRRWNELAAIGRVALKLDREELTKRYAHEFADAAARGGFAPWPRVSPV